MLWPHSRARAVKKGIARHTDASTVVWTLTDNGKLANQIARLATIVVKIMLLQREHKNQNRANFLVFPSVKFNDVLF